MVSVSVRQNRSDATDQNTVERHSGDRPGLTEIPRHGYYDWAGRRLFLPSGAPDPETPGAYRYQHDPECCDLTAPDSDPASPRYEPPHLRHQPGDTFEIGGKPHDPHDPGPYGTPAGARTTAPAATAGVSFPIPCRRNRTTRPDRNRRRRPTPSPADPVLEPAAASARRADRGR